MLVQIALTVSAFLLGACPFSLWIGKLFLGSDIRDYGDGNPGAANVFRAGGRIYGYLAVILDVAKGIPFVFLAYSYFGLSGPWLAVVALSAIMGHAFSPFLRWHGGKAIAVTFGVLLAIPQHDILLSFIIFVLVGYLFINTDAWVIIFGAAGSMGYLVFTGGFTWASAFILCVLTIFIIKHFHDLHAYPSGKGRLVRWVQILIHRNFLGS